MNDRVLFYGGEFGYPFSNFSAFAVEWRGRVWMTSEHAYQAAKFDDICIVDKIHSARSAYDALKLAHKHSDKMRSNWSEEKISVMEEVLRQKMRQHPYVEKQLRQSGFAELIEDSEKDSFWGRGDDWNGENNLGKLWMKLRSELI